MGGGMNYTMIDVGEGTGGGMMKHPMAGAPSAWLAYVSVDKSRGSGDQVVGRRRAHRKMGKACGVSRVSHLPIRAGRRVHRPI